MKLSYRLLLSLLLIQGSAMAAEPLFKVTSSSPSIPADSYSTTCTINAAGQVITSRNTVIFKSGTAFNSTESKTVKLSVANLRKVINETAKGNITGVPLVGGGTHQYFAYQKPVKGVAKEILLLDKNGGMSNDSPLVASLSKFIDGLCGDIAQ
jgi:hypothetical protein